MRHLTFRLIVAVVAFTLGTAAATWCSLKYFSQREPAISATKADSGSAVGEANRPVWEKVDMGGKVTFYVPPHLTTRTLSNPIPHRAFRREGMEVTMFLNGIGASGPCIAHADRTLRRYEISRVKVGNRDATMGYVESAAFDLDDTQPLKGMILCVPSIGDGEHEFVVQARYKGEQDRQDVMQIVNSIRFQ